MVVGDSWTILKAQNFAKKAPLAHSIVNSQPIFGMNWLIIEKNSSDLGHFIFTPLKIRREGSSRIQR